MDNAAFASRRSELKYQRMTEQKLGGGEEGQEESKESGQDNERLKRRKDNISNDV
jgi:hypothetical protein